MARLFITPRELNFISDLTKEIIKDVIGQQIRYYPVSEHRTQTHGVYNEALKKVFDNPIAVDALVDNNFQMETKVDQFGVDLNYKIEVFIQHRDLVEKSIHASIGDYFSFSDIFYEVSELSFIRNIYGMPEHKDGIKLVGTRVRESQFKAMVIGPTDISHPEADAVQKTFVQQRGYAVNQDGETGDVRDLVRNGVLDAPLSGPRQVSERGDPSGSASAFYDEE